MHWPNKIHTSEMLRTPSPRPHNFSNGPTVPFKICHTPGLGRELVTERVSKPRRTKIPPSEESGGGGEGIKKKSSGLTEMEIEINSDLIGHEDLITFISCTYVNKYHI